MSNSVNIARIDLISIHLVVLCADSGSLGAAAKVAHMSKSAASQRLASLESALGTPLFHRDPRGLQPTQAGVDFTHRGRTILNEVRQLSNHLSTMQMDREIDRYVAPDRRR